MATAAETKPNVFNVPNQLTASRLVLSVLLFVLISFECWLSCLIVFAVAAFTDWLDGYLARKHGLTSALGRMFDPLVDKVLVCGAFIFLLGFPAERVGLVPWMVTLVVARELLITGLRGFVENAGVSFGADWLGKIKMVLQCAALLVIFLVLYLDSIRAKGLEIAFLTRDLVNIAMVVATAASGLQYLGRAALILRMHRDG